MLEAPGESQHWEPVRVQSVPEIVAAKLRETILAGQLKPGDRLVEQRWAARFGIGQPTFREALRELELQGFVRKSRQRGTYVTELTGEECRKLLEVRMALETVAIHHAAARMTPQTLERIGAELARIETAACTLDLASFHQADMAFHQCIWELAENEHLSRMLEQVAFKLFAFIKMRPADGAEYAAAARQHREIFEAIRSGDPAVASQAFTQTTLKFWKEQQGVDTGALPR